MPKIREDEWLAELVRLSVKNDQGHTAQEWSVLLGVSWKTALGYLSKARELGRLKHGHRTAYRINGKSFPQDVYRILPPAKTKPRAK